MATKRKHPVDNPHPCTAKRTQSQRELDRVEMMHLLRRGWTKTAIAEKFGVTQEQISYDYKIVIKEVMQSRDEDTQALVATKLEEYAEVKRQAWEAWERSKTEALRVTEKTYTRGNGRNGKGDAKGKPRADGSGNGTIQLGGPVTETTEQRTYQCGDPRFLQIILDVFKAERELLALDPLKSLELSGKGTVGGASFNWDLLAAALPEDGSPVPDVIEQQIHEASLPVTLPHKPTQTQPQPTTQDTVIEGQAEG